MTELPRGESLRRAVRWISSRLEEAPDEPIGRLIDAATLRFDLSPRDAEGLIEFYRDVRRAQEPGASS